MYKTTNMIMKNPIYLLSKNNATAVILYYKFETEEKALDEFFVLFNTFYKEKYNSSLW